MSNVCELTPDVEPELLAVEALFDDEPTDEELSSRPARVFASMGAWLVERFAHVPGSAFIEDGRLAAYSRELRRTPVATAPKVVQPKVIH